MYAAVAGVGISGNKLTLTTFVKPAVIPAGTVIVAFVSVFGLVCLSRTISTVIPPSAKTGTYLFVPAATVAATSTVVEAPSGSV
jgi:hypothetical protein